MGGDIPRRLTPPPRFYATGILGQTLPPEYNVTPMLTAKCKKRRYGLPDLRALQVLFQEFERNVYEIPVKRMA